MHHVSFELSAHTLTVITTNKCTARCEHCCINSGPERSEKLDFIGIKRIIDEFNEQRKLTLVVFAGGEPTVLKNELHKAISYCREKKILTRMVTNASWAITPDKAKRTLQKFRTS